MAPSPARALPALLALLPAMLAAAPPAASGGPDGLAPPPGPVGAAAVDCAGDFAAAGISNRAVAWALVLRAYAPWSAGSGPEPGPGEWRSWSFAHTGTHWLRHGALTGFPALYYEIHLEADGAALAAGSCGLPPGQPGALPGGPGA